MLTPTKMKTNRNKWREGYEAYVEPIGNIVELWYVLYGTKASIVPEEFGECTTPGDSVMIGISFNRVL